MVAVRAGVGTKIHVDGGDGAIFLGPHFHLHLGHVAGGVADELLFTGVAEGDRTAGDLGRPGAHLFQQDILLGAKTAPYPLLDHVHLMLLEADDTRHLTAHVPRHLGRGVNDQTIPIHVGEADVRLGRALLGLGRFVGALDNLVRLGKALGHVADLAMDAGGQVLVGAGADGEVDDHVLVAAAHRAGVLLLEIRRGTGHVDNGLVVHQRCIGGHRLIDSHDRWQNLILDLDEFEGRQCDGFALGHHGGDPVTYVAHLAAEHTAIER